MSPLATLLIVALTLFGMLPMYRRVAAESPNGQGSVAMLERLLPFWWGKLFVLALLGFVATSWIITITLSSADATAHFVENPFAPDVPHRPAGADHHRAAADPRRGVPGRVQGGRRRRGADGRGVPAGQRGRRGGRPGPHASGSRSWWTAGSTPCSPSAVPANVALAAFLAFPLLVLGLSGFETGVSMMPLVHAEGHDEQERLRNRIANTRKLLTVAAVIMSVYLIATSFITTVLVPPEAFEPGGQANGRALAYLAHELLGDAFGTVYDISSILILWFAGASAMAGLINIVPALPARLRDGPGLGPRGPPGRARLHRGLDHHHDPVPGRRRRPGRRLRHRHPGHDGVRGVRGDHVRPAARPAARRHRVRAGHPDLRLRPGRERHREARRHRHLRWRSSPASSSSPWCRGWLRVTELRADDIDFDPDRGGIHRRLRRPGRAARHRQQTPGRGPRRVPRTRSVEQRTLNPIPDSCPIVFLEVDVADPSDFAQELHVHGVEVDGYRVLRTHSPAVPNALAAIMLRIRDETGMRPHLHFQWSEGNPLAHLVRFILLGQGETAPVTREILRQAEPNLTRRPVVHVGG